MSRPATAAVDPGNDRPPFDLHPAPKSKRRIWLLAIGALVLLVVVLVGVKAGQIFSMINAGKLMVPPPESVTTAKAETMDWQGARSAVGSVVAVRSVILAAELTGTVRSIEFESGSTVKKGAVLVRQDTSSEEAQLASSLADLELAKQTLERARNLRKDQVNTQAELEAAEARAKQAQATVDQLRATIAKKVIRAPFDGRVGIRQMDLGQMLSPGTPVVSIQTVDPIYVEFQLPQQALATVKLGQKVSVGVDVFAGRSWTGEVTTINPEVDPATRNVRMRATVPNPDGQLTPGMFANVEVLSGQKNSVVAVPVTSVIFAPYGDSVFITEPGKDAAGKPATVVRQKFVRLGERRGDFVAVVSGLNAGEMVVANGAFKLRNGLTVAPNNALAPPTNIAPTPVDN